MTTPTDRNRLADEASPYLRQHEDNPVNWQPWDDEAFETAKQHDVPVFVSIGYSACHWCHVMEEESFADEDIAALLNEEFVPIKVDREERPDVDSVYMTVCQLVSGGGGWPLSAWCTPDGDPFYVGTYFPPESKGNRPGFKQLCERIADSWNDPEQRAEMENRADQWVAAAKDQLESVPDQPGEAPGSEIVDEAAAAAIRAFDEEHGGFGSSGPKFPQPGRIDLLLRAYSQTGQRAALDAALGTLDGMADGGVYDQVGGGFHRYATDRSWTVPHFEKMLYDNAELPQVYLDAYQLTGDPKYAHVAQDALTFVSRELQHSAGGFFSTLDARSLPPDSRAGAGDEPEEGAFYTWTPGEIDDVLDDLVASLVKDRYGVTKRGNFEGGTTVLEISASSDSLAAEYDLSVEDVKERLLDARVEMYEAREERPRPARDEKVLASWNGRTISAFANAGQVLGPEFTEIGEEALSFVRENLWDGEELARRWLDGDLQGPGYLEDYAFVARGAFDLYQTTGDVDHLAFAFDLADAVVEEFYDADAGTIYFTAADGEELIARPQELTDQSTPSSLGIAVDLLLDLDGFHPDRDYRKVAEAALDTHADRIQGRPLEHVSLSMAADKAARGSTELTIAAEGLPEEWRKTLAQTYLPGAVLARRPPTADGLDAWLEALGFDAAPPVWANRDAVDGEPTVYACKNFTCSQPKTDLDEALDWFGGE